MVWFQPEPLTGTMKASAASSMPGMARMRVTRS
jgi:hypothetical protein